MSVKSEIMNDMKFRTRCCEYGLDWSNFEVVNDVIVVNTEKDDVIVLVDKSGSDYVLFDVRSRGEILPGHTIEEIVDYSQGLYQTAADNMPDPFRGYSIKRLVELASKIEVHETNHGHSCDVIVYGEELKDDPKENFYLYTKFMGEQIKRYFKMSYQMKMLGFPFPDIHTYLTALVANIDECVKKYAENGVRVEPANVAEHLGQDMLELNIHELYGVLNYTVNNKLLGGNVY